MLKKIYFVLLLLPILSTLKNLGHNDRAYNMVAREEIDKEKEKKQSNGFWGYVFSYVIVSYVVMCTVFLVELHSLEEKIIEYDKRGTNRLNSFQNSNGFWSKLGAFVDGVTDMAGDAPEVLEAIKKRKKLEQEDAKKKLLLSPIYFPQLVVNGTNVFYDE